VEVSNLPLLRNLSPKVKALFLEWHRGEEEEDKDVLLSLYSQRRIEKGKKKVLLILPLISERKGQIPTPPSSRSRSKEKRILLKIYITGKGRRGGEGNFWKEGKTKGSSLGGEPFTREKTQEKGKEGEKQICAASPGEKEERESFPFLSEKKGRA